MNSHFRVRIEVNNADEELYSIKDLNNIAIGKFKLIEMNKEARRCSIVLTLYRQLTYTLLKETLELILTAVYKNESIYKILIKCSDGVDIRAFLDLGFTLEGILCENQYINGEFVDELLLGITRYEFQNKLKYSNILLEEDDIYIKNLTPGDAEDLLQYYIRNKKHLEPYEPIRDEKFFEIETQRMLLGESYRQFMKGTTIDFGIFSGDTLIGKIKVSNIVYASIKSGIIGYSLDKDYCGKGYMKKALCLVIKYMFETCDLHRLEASALVSNEKSRNVLRRCGFKLIGINEKYLYINGKWSDHVTYSIIKENFNKV